MACAQPEKKLTGAGGSADKAQDGWGSGGGGECRGWGEGGVVEGGEAKGGGRLGEGTIEDGQHSGAKAGEKGIGLAGNVETGGIGRMSWSKIDNLHSWLGNFS